MADTKAKTSQLDTSKPFNLLGTMAISMEPVLIKLIQRLCLDEPALKGKEDEMIQRYIHGDEKAWKKMVKKFKPKSTRSKSGYTIFLSDPVNIEKIKKNNSDKMMKELNPNKGDSWKNLRKNNEEMFNRYNNVAKLFNHKLIDFDDSNKEQIRTLIKTWMYEKSIDELNELLKNIKEPIKKEKKEKKEKKDKKEKKQKKEKKDKKKEKKVKKPIVDSDDEEQNKKEKKEYESDDSSIFDVNDTQAI